MTTAEASPAALPVMKALAAEMLSSVFDFERCAKFTSLL